MFEIENLDHPHLKIDHWRMERASRWCVIGRNGAGKQYVDKLVLGTLSDVGSEAVKREVAVEQIRLVSFEAQQLVYENELRLAANDSIADEESATRAKDFLPARQLDHPLIDRLEFRHRLSTPYSRLSTGESRKLLVLQAVLEGARLLILDNPFDSLDSGACKSLSEALASLRDDGITLLLLLSNRQDIPVWCENLAVIDGGQLELLDSCDDSETHSRINRLLSNEHGHQPDWPDTAVPLRDYRHPTLVELKDCTVSYSGAPVLAGVEMTIAPLQHTLVTGENGSGKSTLLGLITGDCPQCFSNDVTVFGHRRGSGESVWDIKRNLGIVSNELHRRYRVRCSALTVVCSGFFDSIGVYDPVGDQQLDIANQWLAAAGLGGRGEESFREMSYGEQRLVLIARALVKSPLMLILDEPTQGLDEINRSRVMNLLETLNARRHSTVVFVSHRSDEHLPLFQQHIHLERPA